MAVLPIKKLNLCASKKDRKEILELIQRLGVLQVERSEISLKKEDTSGSVSLFKKMIGVLNYAISIVKKIVPDTKEELGIFSESRVASISDYNEIYDKQESILKDAYDIIEVFKNIEERKSEISEILSSIESLKPWSRLDIPIGTNETLYTKIILGMLPFECQEEILKREIKDKIFPSSEFYLEVLDKIKNQTCIFIIVRSDFEKKIMKYLDDLGFAKPFSYNQSVLPSEKIENLELELSKCYKKIENYKKKIIFLSNSFEKFLFLIDFFTTRIEKYKVISKLSFTENVFIISGFIPQEKCKNFERILKEKFDVFLEFKDPNREDDVPIILKNLPFCEPLEVITQSYSLPSKEEIDPTFVMSFFYYVLFGIMLSDAAYGLIIVLGSLFALKKFKNVGEKTRKNFRMFFLCGISTIFWGVMFGSYFGDIIEVVASRFFGNEVKIIPLWFSPVDKPMAMLGFSLLLGIIHIFTGLGMKLFSLLKSKAYKSALYDVGFWYFLVGGLICLAVSSSVIQDMFNISFGVPNFVSNFAKILSIIGAVGILLTAGRRSRGIIRILKGLYELYNVTGYLSDILSYSRLLALGLATGIIASVFNTIAKIASGTSLFGIVIFLIIFSLGHALNIGLNLLGAYVHTNRLQFVEFFGKFYEGGGREFLPFKFKTKYFRVENAD